MEVSIFKFQKLSDLALQTITQNFEDHISVMGIQNELVQKNLFKNLNLNNCPIEILSKSIEDDSFWKDACKKKFNVVKPEDQIKTCKSLYLEHFLQEQIRSGSRKNPEEIHDMMSEIGKYIMDLKIVESKLDDNLGLVFPYLSNIESLVINVYCKDREELRVENFGMTDNVYNSFNLSLHKFVKLEELNLANNRIGFERMEKLIENLSSLSQLKILNLSKNMIDSNALKILSHFLNDNQHIKLNSLDLSFNNLDLGSGHHLSEIITCQNEFLKNLNLKENMLTNEDCSELFRTLIQLNPVLTHLNCSSNLLDEAIFPNFIDFLQNMESLELIDLELNQMKLTENQINKLKNVSIELNERSRKPLKIFYEIFEIK